MKHIRSALLCFALVLCTLPTALAQPATQKTAESSVLLRYHFHAGDVTNVNMVMEQKINQEIQGQQISIDQTTGTGYSIVIQSVDAAGNATAKITYKTIRFKMDGPTGPIDYDSTKPGSRDVPGGEAFGAMLSETIGMKFAPDGQVLEITGVDEMIKHVISKAGDDEPKRTAMETSLKTQFGDKAMKQMFEQVTRIYPDHAIKIGETWTRHAEIEKGMPLIMDNTYTLAGRNKGVASIGVKTAIKTNPKGAPVELGQLKIGYDLSGQQEGKLTVDEATGWPLQAKMTQKLTGKMHMEGQQLPGPMTVPVTIESVITVTSELSTQKVSGSKATSP